MKLYSTEYKKLYQLIDINPGFSYDYPEFSFGYPGSSYDYTESSFGYPESSWLPRILFGGPRILLWLPQILLWLPRILLWLLTNNFQRLYLWALDIHSLNNILTNLANVGPILNWPMLVLIQLSCIILHNPRGINYRENLRIASFPLSRRGRGLMHHITS